MNPRPFFLLLLVDLVCGGLGCSKNAEQVDVKQAATSSPNEPAEVSRSYEQTIAIVRSENDVVRSFDAVFRDATHEIEAFITPHRKWRSRALLHGRYIVTLVFPMMKPEEAQKTKLVWIVSEFDDAGIVVRSDGRLQTQARKYYEFGYTDWRKFVDSGGDWRTIGLLIVEGQPVKNI